MQRKRNETIAESTIQNIFSATKQKGIKNRYVEKKKKKDKKEKKKPYQWKTDCGEEKEKPR